MAQYVEGTEARKETNTEENISYLDKEQQKNTTNQFVGTAPFEAVGAAAADAAKETFEHVIDSCDRDSKHCYDMNKESLETYREELKNAKTQEDKKFWCDKMEDVRRGNMEIKKNNNQIHKGIIMGIVAVASPVAALGVLAIWR